MINLATQINLIDLYRDVLCVFIMIRIKSEKLRNEFCMLRFFKPKTRQEQTLRLFSHMTGGFPKRHLSRISPT